MYFDTIARLVSERIGCDVSTIKPESTFSELGIDSLDTVELDEKVATIDDLDKFIQSRQG